MKSFLRYVYNFKLNIIKYDGSLQKQLLKY